PIRPRSRSASSDGAKRKSPASTPRISALMRESANADAAAVQRIATIARVNRIPVSLYSPPMTLIGTPAPTPLTRNQIRGFWAAWGGWALDGMDSFIYALVLTPALRELLPRSGIPNTTENVAFYGSV